MLIKSCKIHNNDGKDGVWIKIIGKYIVLTWHISATVRCVVCISFWHFNKTQISLVSAPLDAFKCSICLYCNVKPNQWLVWTTKWCRFKMFHNVCRKASASPWLIYIWDKTLDTFGAQTSQRLTDSCPALVRSNFRCCIREDFCCFRETFFGKAGKKKASQNLRGSLTLFVNQEVRAC